jgi:hypothetical protein
MNAKKRPQPDARHLEPTRKVDQMSELAAEMLLVDADATLPPPEESPGNLSAVRATPRPLGRPHLRVEPAGRGSRVVGAIVLVLVVALVAVSAAGAYYLTR